MNFFDLKKLVLTYSKSTVLKNILLVGGLTVLVKLISFYKETVVASAFGLSELLDTFFIAMLIPGFVSNLFTGAFGSVFIPNYVKASKLDNDLRAFQATGFLITIGVSTLFTIIAILITDTFLESFFSGHSKTYYDLIKIQFYYIVPCIFIWGLNSLLHGLLHISGEFRVPTFVGVITPISFLICIIFFKEQLGQKVLSVSLLLGTLLEFILILLISFIKKIIKLSKPNFNSPDIKIMLKQVPAKVLSGFLTGLIPVTDQYFAAKLAIGSIAALNYGLKIPAFLTSILIISMGKVLLPHFSKLVIEDKKLAFDKLFFALKRLFIATSIAAVCIIVISPWLIEFLFERGEFTSKNTDIVSYLQIIFLVYAPFTVCGMVIVNFLTSINENNFMAKVAFIAVILNLVLDFIFMKYFGVFGIALCTTTVFIVRAIILYRYTLKLKKQHQLN
ncbi:murein biosynthesis integral membrane protein MurJ [Hyunsoonleella pacifica]|uniref:Virulence factor MviN n=1 Tax=Hyunsoonleella pacifica TaxID=1080224 RepID=A0A4Q9FS25_9FLAO|nr:lipid II flippase MurJ [Hyunsoonleella pacifica]TBN17666.1 virulence factor MviN [Hyunsoonleella pacifica]GGD10033.1 putative lipid II flippase MurJ [Hyunsoonleella pacifica]